MKVEKIVDRADLLLSCLRPYAFDEPYKRLYSTFCFVQNGCIWTVTQTMYDTVKGPSYLIWNCDFVEKV